MKAKKIVLFGLVTVLVLSGVIVFALTWNDSGSGMAAGTFNDTLWNSTDDYVYLNWTDASNTTYVWNGTYLSVVKDMGDVAQFLNLTWEGKPETCPGNMSYIDKLGGFCIDKYEASCWNADGSWNSTSKADGWREVDTIVALAGGAYAGSSPGKYPWVYISPTQARTACENAGKYLCTSEQWLAAANINGTFYDLPETITDCNVVSGSPAECQNTGPLGGDVCNTSYMSDCVSSEGVYDMVGNVWGGLMRRLQLCHHPALRERFIPQPQGTLNPVPQQIHSSMAMTTFTSWQARHIQTV